uniref:C2H2-type domain-containing protein n=1 Tax=Clastoptera arizonana TaxID=38151 RepID=A0A1B6CP64_9HEMI
MSLEEFLSQIFLSLENFLQKVSLKENLTHTSDWKRTNSESFCNILPVNPIFSDVPLSPAKTDNWSNEETKVDFEDVSVTAEDNKTNYKCQQCGRKFRTNARFSSHVCKTSSSEIASRPLISDCDESSECVDDVDIEYPVSNQADLPVFVCSSCLSSFPEANQFEQHTCMNSIYPLANSNKNKCKFCGKVFKNRSNCTRHLKNVHKIGTRVEIDNIQKFICVLCVKTFSSKGNLQRHKEAIHLSQHDSSKLFKCHKCNFQTPHKNNLKRHLNKTNHEKNDYFNEQNFSCSICDAKFRSTRSLKHHEIKMHLIKKRVQILRKCPLCNFISEKSNKNDIYSHFEEKHGIKMKLEEHIFNSVSDFMKWKREMEVLTTTSFVKNRGQTNNIKHYLCHRCGLHKYKGLNKRHLKITGSCKIGAFCPASMKVTFKDNGEINVLFCRSHVGHKNELMHKRLTKEERNFIVAQLILKKSYDEILRNVRNSLNKCKLQRIHIINKKDIANIEKSLHLNSKAIEQNFDNL